MLGRPIMPEDVHNLAAFENAFRCRAENLEAAGALAARVAALTSGEALAVVSPDAGGIKRAERLREHLARRVGGSVDAAFVEKYRSEGLALFAELEAAVAARLLQQAAARGLPARPQLARVASISIFGAAHLAVSRASTGAHPGHVPMDDLRAQVRQIVDGYFAGLATQGPT